MYTVATFVFAKATGLSFLTVIPPVAWRHGGSLSLEWCASWPALFVPRAKRD